MIGFGGGFFVVPVMYYALKLLSVPQHLLMHVAVGTSLMIMIFTAANSTYHHYQKGSITWRPVLQLLPSLVLGTISATELTTRLSSTFLRYFFIFYLMYTIIDTYLKKVFLEKNLKLDIMMPNKLKTNIFGFFVGMIATLLGVGGSVMTVPFFRKRNISMIRSVAMATALTLPISFIGALGYFISGYHAVDLPAYSTGFIYWPAAIGVILGGFIGVPIGASLVYKISDKVLAKSYLIILILVLLAMLL